MPAPFAGIVTLPAHQKAADYTIAKTRFGLLELAFGAAVLLGWTLLGGLDALNQALLGWLGRGMTQQLALLACFALISGALELPFDAVPDLRHRGALRLQQDERSALADRSGQVHRCWAPPSGCRSQP